MQVHIQSYFASLISWSKTLDNSVINQSFSLTPHFVPLYITVTDK